MPCPSPASDCRRVPLNPLGALALTAVLIAPSALAQEALDERAPLLYENHCLACHDSQAHVRANRKAHSLADVRNWVGRWAAHLELGWNAATRDAVARYVYRRYYANL